MARSRAQSTSYVLPLRWTEPGPIAELAEYLRGIGGEVGEIVVVDGSPSTPRLCAASPGTCRPTRTCASGWAR